MFLSNILVPNLHGTLLHLVSESLLIYIERDDPHRADRLISCNHEKSTRKSIEDSYSVTKRDL